MVHDIVDSNESLQIEYELVPSCHRPALVKIIGSMMLAAQSLGQVSGDMDDICYRLVPTETATYNAQADLMVHQFYGLMATRSEAKNILP